MKLPRHLDAKLADDQAIQAAVFGTINTFEPWLSQNRLVFFDEYTDHGMPHIESTLKTASSLICDAAWDVITPADAGALTIATLLHDCAMHLTEDGFLSLVDPSTARPLIEGFGDKAWPLLWEEFLAEASRFDGKTLKNIFGNTDPSTRPPLDPQRWTLRDRKLIGEFIRRHHARMAHEVALAGVPGHEGKSLEIQVYSEDMKDIIGVIGRSHGIELRRAVDYLKRSHNIRNYREVHAPFLMAALRIADYLQVDSERAPHQALYVRKLRSPISQGEWRAHHAIRNVSQTHDDPESIVIDAMPEDVSTFLRLRDWMAGIQAELDKSWAVLGEVYGPLKGRGADKLGLVLRRVHSNINDVGSFARQVAYIPRHASFEAADADLLKLLVGPLYGNRPEIGMRELIQNALDAVRELRMLSATRPELVADGDVDSLEADVVASVESDGADKWVVISDRGVGMSEAVICDYFLRAGASFRNSDAWKKDFMSQSGSSKILRTGRFGIGALAAFLLGPEVSVSTRHVSSPNGIAFEATLETEHIEMRRQDRPVGTTVKIRIDPTVAGVLAPMLVGDEQFVHKYKWSWYCLSEPSLACRHFSVKRRPLPQEYRLPDALADLPREWRRVSSSEYRDIQWTFSDKAPRLACNGIVIEDRQPIGIDVPRRVSLHYRPLHVSVFDSDGALPLNLQRDRLTGVPSFADDLYESVHRDLIAYVLLDGPAMPPSGAGVNWFCQCAYPGLVGAPERSRAWVSTSEGYGINEWSVLKELQIARLLLVPAYFGSEAVSFNLEAGEGAVACPVQPAGLIDWARYVLQDGGMERFQAGRTFPTAPQSIQGRRLLVTRAAADSLMEPRRLRKSTRRLVKERRITPDWVCLEIGKCADAKGDHRSLVDSCEDYLDRGVCPYLGEWFLDSRVSATLESPLLAAWRRSVVAPVLPFDADVRRVRFSNSFDALATFIQMHHESPSAGS